MPRGGLFAAIVGAPVGFLGTLVPGTGNPVPPMRLDGLLAPPSGIRPFEPWVPPTVVGQLQVAREAQEAAIAQRLGLFAAPEVKEPRIRAVERALAESDADYQNWLRAGPSTWQEWRAGEMVPPVPAAGALVRRSIEVLIVASVLLGSTLVIVLRS